MIAAEVTSLSSKGQIVIPQGMRSALGLTIGAKLMIVTDGSNLLLKPIEQPRAESFRKLIEQSRQFARSVGLKRTDLHKAIQKAKRESSR
jgi:antitoxin PrlF